MKTLAALRVGVPFIALACLGCGPAQAAPALHEALPADVLVLSCTGGRTFTGVSGELRFLGREGLSGNGSERFGGTVTLHHVMVTDGLDTYRAIGSAAWAGGFNANTGRVRDHATFHIQVMGERGTVAAVKISGWLLEDGTIVMHDNGDCTQPE